MTTHSKRILTFQLPKLGEASLDELKSRAGRLREAVSQEREISRIVAIFHDDLANEGLFHELSKPTDDATFRMLLGDRGILALRYAGEYFEKQLFHCAELGLFHGSLRSSQRIGCAFQFAGDTKGIVSASPYAESTSSQSDFYRYSIVPATGFPSRGGKA